MNTKRNQAKDDEEKYFIKCDSIPIIIEKPEIFFAGFKMTEIDTLKFQILRNNKKLKDTILTETDFRYISENKDYMSINIPYEKFLKTDTIIVKTNNKLHYYISGFHHYAYLHYGMFGNLGSYDCRLSEYYTINNSHNNTLIKKGGWINPALSKSKELISAMSPKFDSIASKSYINKAKATAIFIENIKNNRYKATIVTCGIEKNGDKLFYLFEEKVGEENYVTIKINAKTGEYKRFKNYPF